MDTENKEKSKNIDNFTHICSFKGNDINQLTLQV